ncbi:MAG: PQQ-binding-like beta-propeller repeat protein [Planctomycetales bacterium]|nr:PQQ-binding-like beta-propeller repeat protein [Planctomycetales bacterium]
MVRKSVKMRKLAGVTAFLGCWSLLANAFAEPSDPMRQWAQWRGPLGTGAAPHGNPPVSWSESKNIRWRAQLFGLGHSTPVVWQDKVFLTTAEPYGEKLPPQPETAPGAHDNSPVTQRHRFWALAFDLKSGQLLWKRALHEALPHEGGHYSGSLASASPVCDSEHVIVSFGSYGLYCLDHAGQLIWQQQLGKMQSKHGHGEGCTPALHGDTLVVNWDHEGQSFLVALNKATGKTLWRRDRDEVTSWASPLIVTSEPRPQVVVAGTNRIRGYDLEKGDVVWECGGLSHNVVASPVASDGMVYVGSSYETRAIMGIRIRGAKGDLTNTDRVVWRRDQRPPYVPSLLLYEGALYYLRHYQGILTRLEAPTGEEPTGPFRLQAMFEIYASPVAAAGRIYVTDRDGVTLVMQHGELPRFLARNPLDDRISASAAIVGDQLLLRGEKWLYCIADEEKGNPRR